MSTVALQTAAQTALEIGAQVALNYATSAISHALDNRVLEGRRLDTFRLMSSTDGAPMPRVYGRVRLGGQVIWASRIKESVTEEKIGKGGPTSREYSYSISFAVALCEGEIAGVERLWANGEPLTTSELTYRVHKGGEDQQVDPLISVIEGESPAYRGTAYIVFEDFPLDAYGGRMPQINAEVIRPVPRQDDGPRLEDLITGVNLLPSSGEFAYHTRVVEEGGVPGGARPINMNNSSGFADAIRALDQLEDQLPNCRSVNIISSWFGTDLRLGNCEIHPGVETRERIVFDVDWEVAGQTRGTAYLVSRDEDGNPVYGGTPSDASLIALIRELKERGFEVGVYPFILMDIPPGNGLQDPYGEAEQAAFPWRGRITAPGSNVAAQVDQFFDREAGYRRFILHHADIAAQAGGVDRFVIGSEMRGMTTAGVEEHYPAVQKLVELAADAKFRLPSAKVTYAADWSEYFGHQVGAKLTYHLDPLWTSENIDLVAIDAYFPLSDWREGEHLDADNARSIHDVDYLSSNVEGGEGYDWYYATTDDRGSQNRTPITDPAYRYKDIRNWLSNYHYNRTADGIALEPTAWVPGSKPVWFSEIGCPAVDKGANQPNVFVDPKSSESFLPYYSSGARDDLIQRNYLRSFISHYKDDPMVDGLHVWCWDARPFPEFPARDDIWADGANWQLGHWLSGRMGRVGLGDVIADICREYDVAVDVSEVQGLIEGLVLERPMTARQALEDICAAFAIDVIEGADRIIFRSRRDVAPEPIKDRMRSDAAVTFVHQPEERLPGDVRLHFIDSERDHQPGLASGARRVDAVNPRDVTLPVVMDESLAQSLATRALRAVESGGIEAEFGLSPDSRLEVGERVSLPGSAAHFIITQIEGPLENGYEARAVSVETSVFAAPLGSSLPRPNEPAPWLPAPALFAFDLPGREGLAVGTMLSPFRSVEVSADGNEATLSRPISLGWLEAPLPPATSALADVGNVLRIGGMAEQIESVGRLEWLSGANRFAVETETGWEIIGVQTAELVGPGQYACHNLLRGLDGSEIKDASEGARVLRLAGLEDLSAADMEIGEVQRLSARAGHRSVDVEHVYKGAHLRPWAPAHLTAERIGEGLVVTFVPRNGETQGWSGSDLYPPGRYRVQLMDADDAVITTHVTENTSLTLADSPNTVSVRVSADGKDYGWGAGAVATVK